MRSALPGIAPWATSVAAHSHIFAISYGFATPASWPLASNPLLQDITYTVYLANEFYLTTYSVDTNLTPWGTARVNLNDSSIANLGNTAPNDPARVNAVTNIANVLGDTNMVKWFGQTFSNKYNNTYNNVLQIAANIVDYINTNNTPTDSSANWHDPNQPQYLGLKVTPYLNELVVTNTISAVVLGPGTNLYTYSWSTSVELWNMYPTTYTNPAAMEVSLSGMPVFSTSFSTGPSAWSNSLDAVISCTSLPNNPIPAGPNSYPVVATSGSIDYTNILTTAGGTDPGPLASFSIIPTAGVTAIYRSPQGRVDYAIIRMTNATVNFPPLPFGNQTYVFDSACNDPRVKPVSYNWTALINTSTLGGPNTGVLTPNVTQGLIPGDGDMSCHANINQSGSLSSVGQLGYIHTGFPWRTFRLQPQGALGMQAADPSPPDWLILDLFSTTNSASVPGRININAQVKYLTGVSAATRSAPVQALVGSPLGPLGPAGAPLVGQTNNILSNVWASATPPSWPSPFQSFTNVYAFVGQICEVSKISDPPPRGNKGQS